MSKPGRINMDQKDYYEILEVNREASPKKIKEAYRSLAFQYHPDRNGSSADALEHMKMINEAYAVLSDPAKRRRYDSLQQTYGNSAYSRFRDGYSEEDIFRGSDINRLFEEISRSFGFRGFEDVFREAYGSGYRTFEFRRGNIFGRGVVWSSGMKQGVTHQGTQKGIFPWVLGKLAGYALKKITGIQTQQGKDRYDRLTLTSLQAGKGGKVPYTDKASSRSLLITIPPGVSHGQMIRLQGLGYGNGSSSTPGDLYLKVELARPLLQKIRDYLKV
jgi:DnaJ-class molecular chaperone